MGNPETFQTYDDRATGDAMADKTEPTMDDIWSQGVDQDKVNETAKSMLLARGPYLTTPPMTVTGQRFEASEKGAARTIFRAYGMITWAGAEEPMHPGVDGSVGIAADKIGRISFSFSPDQVSKVSERDGKTRIDLSSKLYVMLVKAYTKVYGQAPSTDADLKSYLENYPVKLTVGTIGDVDVKNMVFAVSPVIS